MSSTSKFEFQTLQDLEGGDRSAPSGDRSAPRENSTAALSLGAIAAKICSLSSERGGLQNRAPLKSTLHTRQRLESSLRDLTRSCARAQEKLLELQNQKIDASSDQTPHLRVLKDLARQQQAQLHEHRQWQLHLAKLLEVGGEIAPLTEHPQILLEALASALAKRQIRGSTGQAADSSCDSAGEPGGKSVQALRAELQSARAEREAAETKARELAAECGDLRGQLLAKIEPDRLGQLELVEQKLRDQQSELERVRAELSQSQEIALNSEQVRAQASQQLGRCEQLESDNRALSAALQELRADRRALEGDLERAREISDRAKRPSEATERGDAGELRELCDRQQEQLAKSRALWEQSAKKLADAQGQLAHLQRERAGALNRAGLVQSRLDEQFQLSQRLKKELLLASEGRAFNKASLESVERELKDLKSAEKEWAGQRLELQRQLVEAAQQRSDARQQVGLLQSAQQQLASSEREQSREREELRGKIAELETRLAESQRTYTALQETSRQQLTELSCSAATERSAALDEQARQAHALQMQLSGIGRQNGELQDQLGKALIALDEQRARADQLAKEGAQAHRALHQMIEQLREKEARAHLLECQLHKKSKEFVGASEQLTGANREAQQLRQRLSESQGAEEKGRQAISSNQELERQIDKLKRQSQLEIEKLARLENLEREHTQLKALLAPIAHALRSEVAPKPEVSEPLSKTVDLFEADRQEDRLRSHLFE